MIRKDRKKAESKKNDAENNYKRYFEAKSEYDYKLPKWPRALVKWKRLYYCDRDDIIYDPETGETCNPNSLDEFVYKQP
ncbi:MAG: hypothetical protein GYA36_16225 [Veillonellaceae bacterium]|nr:hypothetical protein [Veillonellaceae bacterium]